MDREQKTNLAILSAIGVVVFILFIFPNLKGAQTAAMLPVFEVDEFAQYPNLVNMLTPGDSLYQSIRNFFVYLHYFYGYPFYFFSALAALPVKIFYGANWLQHPAELMMVLRQTINVLPMILSIGILTWIQTRFRGMARTVGLFVFLLIFPAVVVNNLWWHPDSLGVLSAVLILFFFDRDRLRLGRDFFISAAVGGVAAGIKYTGVFFVLAVPLYIIWAWVVNRYTFKKVALAAAGFVVLMFAALVASNPLLLLPQERAAIIETQVLQFQQTGQGIMQSNPEPFFNNSGYPEDFRIHYGEMDFLFFALAALFVGILFSKKRWYYAVLLAWFIPLVLTINFSATRRTHYFLPVILPLVSCMTLLLPGKGKPEDEDRVPTSKIVQYVILGFMMYQASNFLPTDVSIYTGALHKEETSPSIAFYHAVNKKLPADFFKSKRVVFRDWKVYYPPSDTVTTEMNWDLPTPDYIKTLDADLILLEKVNLALFGDPKSVKQAVNPGNMQPVHEFYAAAKNNNLAGYQRFYEDNFGVGFIKQE
jgi:hypothetical protein